MLAGHASECWLSELGVQSYPAKETVMLIDSPMEKNVLPFGFNEDCSDAYALRYPKESFNETWEGKQKNLFLLFF